MSTWTDVIGIVRFLDAIGGSDALGVNSTHKLSFSEQKKFIRKMLGKPCLYDRIWTEHCLIPKGSEGSLDYRLVVDNLYDCNTHKSGTSLLIAGSLRDYDNVEAVKEWFLNVCKALEPPFIIDNAVLSITCNSVTTCVTYDDIIEATYNTQREEN